jgi:MOSC domain-containing protein YiiM
VTSPQKIRVEGLFISPGHNFFGHYGQPPGEHETVEMREIECVAGHGIKGDRFFDFKNDYKGQITCFSLEVFNDVCKKLGVTGKSAGAARRNVVTRGVDLNTLIGRQFELQGVQFVGVCECSPCHWMNMAIALGAEAALRGRGGLRARIVTDGKLRVDG